MKKIDPAKAPTRFGTKYPAPYDEPCAARKRWLLGRAAGLTQFGVNILKLAPGVWSSQRHWHSREDEFVYVLDGEVTLVTDAGEETLVAGECAGFKAGTPDGHHFVNRSDREATLLEVGTSSDGDDVDYPDVDLQLRGQGGYTRKDGTPYARPKP